jgi:SAM-dependent methyltransferase
MTHVQPDESRRATPASCCSGGKCSPPKDGEGPAAAATTSTSTSADATREAVRQGYAEIARRGGWSTGQSCAPGGGCCGPATFSPEQLVAAIGYSLGELAHAPADANLGLSCGNPTALASLRHGETVLDLGAGAGFDCFVAGPKVGPTGRVIGVDMTAEMILKARQNIAAYQERSKLSNVEFRLGEIENLPVADATVDVVISNCVLNLSPDKPRVWREIARVLKPGGRVAVSDLALLQPLPPTVVADLEALVGCVAGAELVETTRASMQAAGLAEITLRSKPEYIDAMTHWEDPLYRRIVEALPPGAKPSDYVTSLDISARKAR